MSDTIRIQVSVRPDLDDAISRVCERLHVSRSAWLQVTLANAVSLALAGAPRSGGRVSARTPAGAGGSGESYSPDTQARSA